MTSTNYKDENHVNSTKNRPQISFRKVAQGWNRAIPESKYITLGTIRYGVRLSPGLLPSSNDTCDTSSKIVTRCSSNANVFNAAQRQESIATATSCSAQRTTPSWDTCCLEQGSGIIGLHWCNNNRTKLPVPTAKNRILSKTQTASSLSTSLAAVSAPPPTHTKILSSASSQAQSSPALLSTTATDVSIRDDRVASRQNSDRIQIKLASKIEPIVKPVLTAKIVPEFIRTTKMLEEIPKCVPPTSTVATTTTAPSLLRTSTGISASTNRLIHNRKRFCGCCQNNSTNATAVATMSYNRTSLDTSSKSSKSNTIKSGSIAGNSNQIGCCCELNLNSESVSVGKFCELLSPVTRESATSSFLLSSPSHSQPSSISSQSRSLGSTLSSAGCCAIANSGKSISKHSNCAYLQKRLPRSILQQNLPEKQNKVPPIPPPRPRNSNYPRNFDSDYNKNEVRKSASDSTVKPYADRPIHRSDRLDPINFRQKVHHFESVSNDANSLENSTISFNDSVAASSSFDLLNCFSNRSVNSENSDFPKNCYSPNNKSEISHHGGCSTKSDPQLIASDENDSTVRRRISSNENNYQPPLLVSRNASNLISQKPSLPLNDLRNKPVYENSNSDSSGCIVLRKFTPRLTKKSISLFSNSSGYKNSAPINERNKGHNSLQIVARNNDRENRLTSTDFEIDIEQDKISPLRKEQCESATIDSNDHTSIRATLVEIVNDGEDDNDIFEYDVEREDIFCSYGSEADDEVDSEICFIDSSQSDIDLISSINEHGLFNGYITTTAGQQRVPTANLGDFRNQQLSRYPVKLLPFNDTRTANRSVNNKDSSYDDNVPNDKNSNLLNSDAVIDSAFKSIDEVGRVVRERFPSSSSVVSIHSLNNSFDRNLSDSSNSLRVSDFNKSSKEFNIYTLLDETVELRADRILPRIDRSQSFDSYKKSAKVSEIVSSASDLLTSAASLTSTSSILSISPGILSPLLYTSQQFPFSGGGTNLNQLKGPYSLGRRVSSSDSFGNFTGNQLHGNSSIEKVLMMERRRNTLDRLQRRFGRKSSPTPSQDKSSSSSSSTGRKAYEKSEVLKELTERLKGNRLSPTPPPVPPPRKPRQSNSLEKPNSAIDTLALVSTAFGSSDDIIPMDADEDRSDHEPIITVVDNYKTNFASDGTLKGNEVTLPPPAPPPPPPPQLPPLPSTIRNSGTSSKPASPKSSLYDTLRPNTSVSNLESLLLRGSRDDIKSAPTSLVNEEDLFREPPRAESRILIGAYAQRTIPFRSISFSQIDFSSSGKYVRSSLNVLRDKWKRDKDSSTMNGKNSSVLPDSQEGSNSGSPVPFAIPNPEHDKRPEFSVSPPRDFDNDRMTLEEIVNPPEVILEEEASVFETEKSEERLVEKDELKFSIEEPAEITEVHVEQVPRTIAANYVNASEPMLATLTEEEIPLESPPETLMQTATTCMIPVPVYECSAREWGTQHVEQQWVNVESNEFGMSPDVVERPNYLGEIKFGENVPENLNPVNNDQVPTISVSSDINKQSDSTPEDRSSEEMPIEFPEVRKRYSNDDVKSGDAPVPRGNSGEDKRRIDKSRRRKGMYIQWPTINKHGIIDSPDWEGSSIEKNVIHKDDSVAERKGKGIHLDFSKLKIKDGQEAETPSSLLLNCISPEDSRTPGSAYSFDPSTPDSESGKPVWPKNSESRRASLSGQSSEEKDEGNTDANISSSHQSSHNRSLVLLRSDSMSDNENESRNQERASPSPSPGDYDLKRYSKRPLRGPYGQMLEAEMKKPGKTHYDEIFQDLKNSDSLNTLSPPIRNRIVGNHSFDETASRQQKNMSRSRKGSAHLPVPAHTRAASTPSQMENTTTMVSIDSVAPQHKRYQGSLDIISLDRTSSTGRLKDAPSSKKLSVDCRDRSPKRASSEALEIKGHNTKRSASNASEKQPKRSLDEMRLSSRTASERSMTESMKSSTNLLPTPELLAELLKGSSERLVAEQRQQMFADTRTHIVQEIFQNEQSYVEDLQTVIVKYLNVLKTPEYAGMIDSKTVDEIFFMVPEIHGIHERFLNELRRRLESWEPQQQVGDAFIEAFSKSEVLETYTIFVNNCNRAKDAIRMTCQARPAFSRFLQNTSREHKGKLTLDNLLIKPVQKFPNYELLFRRLIKHTDIDHPDQKPLQEALKLAHDILLHINAKKKEGQENGQREAVLRELESVIEGVNDLVASERQFVVLDVVSMPNGQGTRKERGFFLFNDLLVITSIKRRSGTIRKPNTTVCPGSVASTLDTNKYKFLMKIPLDNIEIVKTKDDSVRKIMNEIDQLVDDCNKIQQISKIVSSLHYPHQNLEEILKDLHRDVDSQLRDLKSQDNQLNMLELTFHLPNGVQNLSVAFSKPETRSQWEENFNDAKQKLAASLERHPIPEFLTSIPIRKTRAGLQFTCAAPTLSSQKDVWVCNSDGYVGQVCVLSLQPEPTVTSCNGVCNARILCVASVPACTERHDQNSVSLSNCETPRSSRNSNSSSTGTAPVEKKHVKSKSEPSTDIKLDSSSSSSDSEIDNSERMFNPTPTTVLSHQHQDSSDDMDGLQSTMWLGTEDGCIHVYNCTDNIRIKKNKIKIQHVSAVYSILYLDNRVFVSLANGDICVYLRDSSGWNTTSPHCIPIGTVTSPVNRLLNVQGKLWCSIQGIIKVLDTKTLQVENQIQISSDSKPITNMAISNNYVWISIQNSAHIKCFHSNSYEQIFEVNLAPSVNKMLCNCDDIIRQHKAACLRVTSLLACRDLIWVGTSAGVLLTITATQQGCYKGSNSNTPPVVTGIPYGHTGHVRFLTFVETETANSTSSGDENGSVGYGTAERKRKRNSSHAKNKPESGSVLIISGGDGYEDFRSSGANTMSEVAGREDSTNHLLLWQM